MGGDVADLAVAAASKVVDQTLDVAAHRATVESYVEGTR
jgi:F0F1-type ATP synthase membrane subunit b/b'